MQLFGTYLHNLTFLIVSKLMVSITSRRRRRLPATRGGKYIVSTKCAFYFLLLVC